MAAESLDTYSLIHYTDLINAFVERLRLIPELVADLGSADNIIPYIDSNPDDNNTDRAIYELDPGSVLVMMEKTEMTEGEMPRYEHVVQLILKARNGHSVFDLVHDITNGVPLIGDKQRWYLCPVMSGVYVTDITGSERARDEENLDYWVITTKTKEVGDQ